MMNETKFSCVILMGAKELPTGDTAAEMLRRSE